MAVVTWKDGTIQRYGSECINKILAGDNSLRRLFEKNRRLAEQFAHWTDVLKRPAEQIARGSEYYGSGLYFIADDKGVDIHVDRHLLWHPAPDWAANQGGGKYVQRGTEVDYRRKAEGEIAQALVWLERRSAEVERFLARVLAKGAAAA